MTIYMVFSYYSKIGSLPWTTALASRGMSVLGDPGAH